MVYPSFLACIHEFKIESLSLYIIQYKEMSSNTAPISNNTKASEVLVSCIKPLLSGLEATIKTSITTSSQDIIARLAALETRMDHIEWHTGSTDDEPDADPLVLRQLELENENIRLRIELFKHEHSIYNDDSDARVDSETLSSDRQLATAWIRRNPPYRQGLWRYAEKITEYYHRYGMNTGHPLPAKTFEVIAREVLGSHAPEH